MARALRITLIAIAGIVGITLLAVGAFAFQFWYSNSHKSMVQTLEVPGRGLDFMLMTDFAGFGDPAWYVYEVPHGSSEPKSLRIGHDHSEAIFWNYDEAGELVEDPKLELVDERYLVFWRGGLRVSLYDIEGRTVLVNDESPWHTFRTAQESGKFQARSQADWVRENLELPIRARLEPSNKSLERSRDE